MDDDSRSFHTGPLPAQLRTTSFLLRPLRVADNLLDYDAMCDRWQTRAWMAQGNPFTPDQNLAALRRHEIEHLARQAFTYTIMNPGETECLGCVYITPLLTLFEQADPGDNPPHQGDSPAGVGQGQLPKSLYESLSAEDAAVRFWLRDSYLTAGWDEKLLQTLRDWLTEQWSFPCLLFHTSAEDNRQRALFESQGFRLLALLDITYGALYEPPSE